MSISLSVGGAIGFSLVAANLPFLNERAFVVGPRSGGPKSLWMRALELLVWYGLAGGLAMGLEQREGQIAPQGWEFYAITACMFLTFAFPGFVYRYLRRGH